MKSLTLIVYSIYNGLTLIVFSSILNTFIQSESALDLFVYPCLGLLAFPTQIPTNCSLFTAQTKHLDILANVDPQLISSEKKNRAPNEGKTKRKNCK